MTDIIEEIRTQLKQDSSWELSAERVRELLGKDHSEFYRRIYEETVRGNPLVDLSTATGRFRQENVAELLTLLELFVGPQAAQSLERAGLFFSHGERLEILSLFLRIAGEAAAEHRTDHQVFADMLYRFGTYRRARGAYLDEYFSVSQLIEKAASAHVSRREYDFPERAVRNVADLLNEYFDRHVLEREAVLTPVCAQLFETAVSEGFERRPEDEWAQAQQEKRESADSGARADSGNWAGAERARGEHQEREQWARRVLELDTREPTRSRLKAAYRALMKRYHPDVNPSGLHVCRRINEAYTILLASIEVSP